MQRSKGRRLGHALGASVSRHLQFREARHSKVKLAYPLVLAVLAVCLGLAVVAEQAFRGPDRGIVSKTVAPRTDKTTQLESDPPTLTSPSVVVPLSKDPSWRPSDESEHPAREAGVIANGQAPLPATRFIGENAWRGPDPSDPSQWYVAFAGVWKSGASADSLQSTPALVLFVEPADPNAEDQYFRRVGVFQETGSSGYLHIVGERGGVLSVANVETDTPGRPGGDQNSSQPPVATHFDLLTMTFG